MNTDKLIETIVPLVTTYGMRIVGVLIAIWVSFRLASWLQHRVTDGLRRRKFDETLSIFFGNMLRWIIIVAAVLACLGVFGIQTTSFAAVIGAAGLAVGLAFQGTLSNFAAGVMLLVFRPFKVGDLVSGAGQWGVVAEIGLFVTAIDTLDHRRVFVPNTAIASGVIANETHHPHRRVDIDVSIDGGADIDASRAALEKAAHAVPERDAKLGHQVFLVGFAPGATKWQVRVWTETPKYWDAWESTVRAVAVALGQAKIPMPIPNLEIAMTTPIQFPQVKSAAG